MNFEKIKMRSVCYRILKSYKDTPHGFVLQKRYPLKMRISDSEEIRFHLTA